MPERANVKSGLRLIGTIEDAAGDAVTFARDGRWASVRARHVVLGRELESLATTDLELPSLGQLRFDATMGALLAAPYVLPVDGDKLGPARLVAGDPRELLDGGPEARGGFDPLAGVVLDDGARIVLSGGYRPPSGLDDRARAPYAGPLTRLVIASQGTRRVLEEGRDALPYEHLFAIAGTVYAANNQLVAFDVGSGTRIGARSGHIGTVRGLALVGSRLATVGADGKLVLGSLATAQQSLQISSAPLTAIAAQGELMAVTGWDDTVRLVAAHGEPRVVVETKLPAHGEAIALSPAGDRLLVACANGALLLFAVEP